jgi:predicted transposase YbfD/YdcC
MEVPTLTVVCREDRPPMPFSPMPAARCHYLLDLLAQVPDPRARRGRRHSLAGLLAVGAAAVIAGSRSFAAIGQWAADAGPDVLASLGAARGPAEESTFRRAFALVSADVLDQVLGAWLWTRTARAGGRMVIAVDGKTVRGAKSKDGKAPHLVAALAHGIGAVLGQVAVNEKSNEIPAVRELLKAFAGLAGVVLTIDALHTQHDTAQLILGRGADYVMTVKANMPTLYKQLKKLPWAAIPAVSSVSKDHGRRARRTIKVALAPAWIGFEGATQVAQLRRTVVKKGKKTVEVVYLITSDRSATPETLAAWVASTGTSRTSFTGSATSPTRKTNRWSGQETHPASWRRSEAWPSASCAWTARPTSPPPTVITPATRNAP